MRCASRLTSSWSGRSSGNAGAPQVRHFIMHMRRAGRVVTPPLNCGVRRKFCEIQTWRWDALPHDSGCMKVSEVLRILRTDGWTEVARRGSHRQLRHAIKPGRVTVPGKLSDDLAPGTLNSILKQAGLKDG
jgi:predicted RNA binding protein YcfA (HicA-like mRNA interferase family)